MRLILAALLLFTIGCESYHHKQLRWIREKAEIAEAKLQGPCEQKVILVATTVGSPSRGWCDDPRHQLQVQVATLSGEEIGVTVACRCPVIEKEIK